MSYNLHTTWQFVLLFFGLVIFAFISWKKPVWGGWLIIFCSPLYLLKIGSWPLTVLEALIWVFVFVWLIKKIQLYCHPGLDPGSRLIRAWIPAFAGMTKEGTERIIKSKLFWPILLVLAGVLISTIFSPDLKAGLGILKSWFLAPIIFAAIFNNVLGEKDGVKVFFSALLASGAAVATISAGYFFFSRLTFDGRLSAFYLSPNHLAMFLAPGLLAGVGLWLETKRIYQKAFLFFVSCFLLLVLCFTYSYGAWLGLFAAAAFVLFYFWKYKIINRKHLFLISCFLFLAFAFMLFSQMYGAHSDKLAGLFTSSRSSWQSRLMIWQAAGKILEDNWILGIGPGMFQRYYLEYQKYFSVPYLEWAVPQPQNLFLAWWMQAGLLGLAGFIWLLVIFFRQAFKSLNKIPSWPAIFLAAMMVYVLVHGLADTTFWKNDLALVFWIIVFLCYKAGHRAY